MRIVIVPELDDLLEEPALLTLMGGVHGLAMTDAGHKAQVTTVLEDLEGSVVAGLTGPSRHDEAAGLVDPPLDHDRAHQAEMDRQARMRTRLEPGPGYQRAGLGDIGSEWR